MTKQEYRVFRACARANGFAYAYRTSALPLYEKSEANALLGRAAKRTQDNLAFRMRLQKGGCTITKNDMKLFPAV